MVIHPNLPASPYTILDPADNKVAHGMPKMRVRLVVSGLFLSLFFLTACHKAVRPTTTNGAVPSATVIVDEATPIAILVFENQTSEPILEHQISAMLKETFLRRGFSIVRKSEEATFILTGKINQFINTPIALNPQGKAEAYRITIGVDYLLSPQKGGVPLGWSDQAYSDFFITDDLINDPTAKQRAIWEIGWNLSETVADTLIETKMGHVGHNQ